MIYVRPLIKLSHKYIELAMKHRDHMYMLKYEVKYDNQQDRVKMAEKTPARFLNELNRLNNKSSRDLSKLYKENEVFIIVRCLVDYYTELHNKFIKELQDADLLDGDDPVAV